MLKLEWSALDNLHTPDFTRVLSYLMDWFIEFNLFVGLMASKPPFEYFDFYFL